VPRVPVMYYLQKISRWNHRDEYHIIVFPHNTSITFINYHLIHIMDVCRQQFFEVVKIFFERSIHKMIMTLVDFVTCHVHIHCHNTFDNNGFQDEINKTFVWWFMILKLGIYVGDCSQWVDTPRFKWRIGYASHNMGGWGWRLIKLFVDYSRSCRGSATLHAC